MYLVQPAFLIADTTVPQIALRAYAQVLAEDLARWIGIAAPRVIVTNRMAFDEARCQSPTRDWARVVNTELFVASNVSDALRLQFVIAHALMHCGPRVAEWECDLAALDWLNGLDVPIVESAACALARTPRYRKRASQFVSGQRIVAIGDALVNRVWQGEARHSQVYSL